MIRRLIPIVLLLAMVLSSLSAFASTTSPDREMNPSLPVAVPLQTFIDNLGISAWHDEGYLGDGQRVGILDQGFAGISTFMQRNTTARVQVHNNNVGVYDTGFTNHGTDVLEVAYKVAPNADFFLCQYTTSEELKTCYDWLVLQQEREGGARVSIINHSAGLPLKAGTITSCPEDEDQTSEPLWRSTVCGVDMMNVLWVNSAGNYGQGYRQERYYSAPGSIYHNFALDPQAPPQEALSVTHSNSGGSEVYHDFIFLSWSGAAELELEVVYQDTLEPVPGINSKVIDPSTLIYDVSVDRPFALRVKNVADPNAPIPTNVPFELYIGKASGMGNSITSPVIAPGDTNRVITVGAMEQNNPAPYSSYGGQYIKPDLVIVGRIELSNGTEFIGTSAAAPIITGVAALVMQAERDSNYFTMFKFFREEAVLPNPSQSLTWGNGSFLMPPPPEMRVDEEATPSYGNAVESIFPMPTPTPSTGPESLACQGGLLDRLKIGQQGYVLPAPPIPNALYENPGRNNRRLTRNVQPDERFTVLDGPVCDGGWNWYQVELADGTIGWTAEGDDYFWLAPVLVSQAVHPNDFGQQNCGGAPVAEFELGQDAIIDFNEGGDLLVTGNPGGSSSLDDILTRYYDNERVRILGGPVCANRGNSWRWYVRSLDSGTEGWISEGIAGDTYMCPTTNPECSF